MKWSGYFLTCSNPNELVLLVGLPFSGKTTWARKTIQRLPSLRYRILSVNYLMDNMKVPGMGRSFQERMRVSGKLQLRLT